MSSSWDSAVVLERLAVATKRLGYPLVLVIEDSEVMARAYRRQLEGRARVLVAASSQEARSILASRPVDLVLSDSVGIPVLRELRARDRRLPVAVVSGYEHSLGELAGLEPVEAYNKPLSADRLCALIERLARV